MGSSKLNSINDPLAQQKIDAANLGLQNYQTASGYIPNLQSTFSNNYGQTPAQTLSKLDPLSQEAYGAIQQDMTGGNGPYQSLKQNLLGSFDAANQQNLQNENQQLNAQGLSGSGAGMAVLGNQGVNAAQQRALLGSQMDTSELGMAQQLGNNLMNYNQTLGFTDPMLALQQIQSLATQPNFQSPETTYYTPSNLWKNLSSSTNAFTVGGGGGGGVAAPNVLGGNGSGAMITPQTLGQMYGLGSQLGTTLGGIMGGVTTASAYSPAMYELGQMIGSSVGSGVGADLGMMALA